MHRGLEAALQLRWRDADSARVLFLVADAPPHTQHMLRTMQAADALRKRGVALYPVGPLYPVGLGADVSFCQSPNSFPCGSLQVANQPMAGTGIGSSASPPSSFTRAAPALMSSTSK